MALATPAQHYYRYEVAAASAALSFWTRQAVVVNWEALRIDAGAAAKCSRVWYLLKQVLARQSAEPVLAEQPFEVRLTLGVPAGAAPRPAALIKPLLDGVIAARHCHDGTGAGELSGRLVADLPQPAAAIRHLLGSPGGEVRGSRALLHRFGAGVQWNPQDDLCGAAEVRIVPTAQAAPWTLTGEVNRLVARPAPTTPG